MRPASRLSLLACGAVAAASLTACANVSGSSSADTKAAPKPAAAVPSNVARLVKTDVGEYLVKPKPGISKKQIDATIAKLKTMKGVQSAVLNSDGKVDVQFYGSSTTADHQAVVKQMAPLGDLEEGI